MGWIHLTVLVDKYKVNTSESVEWAVESGWVLAEQLTAKPKR